MQKISFEDKRYPALLRETGKPPKNLFIKGNVNFEEMYSNKAPIIAIVGTRRPTLYGKDMAFALARDLAFQGAVIVSGLALGIDTEAHKGALEGGGITWAVLGSGIENIQPTHNRPLAEKIIHHNGLIISEYEGETPATQWTFPERNRIIAGLSYATIVIEAPERSGALITARLALDANREVGAVPGEATSVHSLGTNKLIKEGAALIRNAEDIVELLQGQCIFIGSKENSIDKLNEVEQNILHSLDMPKTADEISALMNCDIQTVSRHLTVLELEGVIENKGGVFYKI